MDATLKTLQQINARFIHNHVTNDVPSHDALLHPDFICISSSGAKINRADYLAAWATLFHPDINVYWDTRDEQISVFGDVALVRATNKWTEIHDGKPVTGMTCYTDIYQNFGGKWLCLQAQLTHVQEANWPDDDTIVSVYLNGIRQ
ncbi:MAG: nuclear transport factor 2 family protein [Notoacmeibacter sp.]